jgi:SanA protein
MLRSRPKLRRALFAGIAGAVLLVVAVAALNAYVLVREDGDATADIAKVPKAQAAVVLGAYVQPDGTMSAMLRDRVTQAAALYEAGKVDRILVSGDHGTWAYDEPDTMRRALQAQGIPPQAIFTDHAGFDTWATMVRARKVFGIHDAIVVTQGFHMARALYLADAAGLHATGFTASLHGYGKQGLLSDAREVLSRVKAVADATVGSDVLLGPAHPIAGDGRKSWGVQHPPSF